MRHRAESHARHDHRARANDITLHIDSGNHTVTSNRWETILLIAAGTNPYDLVDAAVTKAASLSGPARPRWDKQRPDALNWFGWCTWDAFYSHVSACGVKQGLETLNAGGVPPRNLIIDDGWQRTDVDPECRLHPESEDYPAVAAEKTLLRSASNAEPHLVPYPPVEEPTGAIAPCKRTTSAVISAVVEAGESAAEEALKHKKQQQKRFSRHAEHEAVAEAMKQAHDSMVAAANNILGNGRHAPNGSSQLDPKRQRSNMATVLEEMDLDEVLATISLMGEQGGQKQEEAAEQRAVEGAEYEAVSDIEPVRDQDMERLEQRRQEAVHHKEELPIFHRAINGLYRITPRPFKHMVGSVVGWLEGKTVQLFEVVAKVGVCTESGTLHLCSPECKAMANQQP